MPLVSDYQRQHVRFKFTLYNGIATRVGVPASSTDAKTATKAGPAALRRHMPCRGGPLALELTGISRKHQARLSVDCLQMDSPVLRPRSQLTTTTTTTTTTQQTM